MPDTPAPFDRDAFREEVHRGLQGLPRETVVLFAARCAWRATPLIFQWKGSEAWMKQHGEGLLAGLTLSLLRGCGKQASSTKAAAAAASAAYAAASAAASADDASAFAAAASAYAAAAAAAADAAAAAYAYAALVFENNGVPIQELVQACREDLSLARSSPGRLQQAPLWPASTPDGVERSWVGFAKLEETRLLWEWFQELQAGQPPLDDMQAWLDAWWQRQPENLPRRGAPQSEAKPAKKPAKPKASSRGEPPTSEAPPSAETPTAEPPVEIRTRYVYDPTCSLLPDTEAPELTTTAKACAAALHTFLASPETQPPLTVSVEAPWGGGKSSLLRYLQRRLEGTAKDLPQPPPPSLPTVWFNPWKHEAGKTLWAAFAVAFERQLRHVGRPRWDPALGGWWWPDYFLCYMGHWAQVAGRQCKLTFQRLSVLERGMLVLRLALWVILGWGLWWVLSQGVADVEVTGEKTAETEMLPKLLAGVPWLSAVVLAWGFLKDMMTQFGSPLKLDVVRLFTQNQHRDGVDDLHRFQEDFRRLLRTYVPKGLDGGAGRVVVFIDDLDRCEAPKAADVLQSLFQMLHIVEDRPTDEAERAKAPGVICILGMDREKVAAAVAAKHEKLLPLLLPGKDGKPATREQCLDFGHTYLEKFIQLTLHLPAMQGGDRDEYLRAITGWKGVEPPPSTASMPSPEAKPDAAPYVLVGETEAPVLPPTAPVSPPPLAATPEQRAAELSAVEKRIQEVEEKMRDGQVAYACAAYVADALENNPRKLKQFLNLLRLRLFLAAGKALDEETLRVGHAEVKAGKLSVHHIAKLVALEIACPRQMNDLRMTLLEHEAVPEAVCACAEAEPALKKLLEYKKEEALYDLAQAPLRLYFHLEGG